MPKAKTNRGKPKTISCPRCGKRFRSETNVLQHMNQPTGSCHTESLLEESARALHQLTQYDQPSAAPTSTETSGEQSVSSDDTDSHWYVPSSDHYHDPPSPNAEGEDGTADFGMDYSEEPVSRKFIEAYEGGCEAFPGGKSFMDTFREDQYANERRQNLYFPFTSQEEWQFASWLLRSRLSVAAIDSLLSLDIFKRIALSFWTGKELRAWAETLPPGPVWLCETLQPEGPTKQAIRLFYRPVLNCLQALLSHPLLASHISFVPWRVWTSAAKMCRIYDEWLSGDRAWNIQDALPAGATILGVVLSLWIWKAVAFTE
ncbi:hypothetical protein HYDPIDRAFT_168314 [Hydnomerulius pinastri MD-312]|uniref:C2H2-type domain-containing protein n=1 Tax=Hydnomerulius pinastri MD-312 TaxID=994086 RepID=A0A0C9VZP1_9AGAM|nr:hypothetical protein HYDPIDRAFT_168314 [Hydnomerulius pinastri MD-312]